MSRFRLANDEVEFLLGTIYWTETRRPVELATAREIFGANCCRSTLDGWFWIPGTKRSAANIRQNGHKAPGKDVSVWIPKQTEIGFKATGIKELEELTKAMEPFTLTALETHLKRKEQQNANNV